MKCAANGCPNLIPVSGGRRGLKMRKGPTIAFVNRVKAPAEGATICFEPIHRIDWAVCDRSERAVEVRQRVRSPRGKALLDIRRRQIVRGDLSRAIRDDIVWIGIARFHLAGAPGSHEIDEPQEWNYGFVAQTIAELGVRR